LANDPVLLLLRLLLLRLLLFVGTPAGALQCTRWAAGVFLQLLCLTTAHNVNHVGSLCTVHVQCDEAPDGLQQQ
jgi:hypothetical protein